MTTPNQCPQCQQQIPPDAPGGMCPHCILDIGMQPGSPDVTAPLNSSGSTPFEAPTIDQLAPSFPALELLQFVGQGGMGAVYKARQIDLDRIVALKILPNRPDDEPNFSERFAREARALAKLTHPNIVLIFEFGQTDDYLYFLMEFVDGVNLRESLAHGKLKPEEALAIVPQICDALQFAHEEGIVHRDIKPENILIDRRGRVRIADFGLAKLVRTSTQGHALTGTRQVMGTLHYMAPEQMEKPTSVDHRADIYSLGVVFYELLTGELPLGRFDPPSEFAATDAQLDAVVMRTLEKEPDRRYQNISEVKTAMSTISNQIPPVRAFEPKAGKESRRRMAKKMVVPFYIEDDWGTLKANGIMTCDGQQLTFELSKKDLLGRIVDGDIKSVAIDIDELVSIECHSSYRERKIHILSSNIDVHRIIPAAKSARIVLKIAAVDAESADRFSIAVKQTMQGRNWSTAFEYANDRSLSQLHPLAQVRFDENRVKRQLSGPASGFLLLAIVNILVAVGTLLLAQVVIPPGEFGPFKLGDGSGVLSAQIEPSQLSIASPTALAPTGQNQDSEAASSSDETSSSDAGGDSSESENSSNENWLAEPQSRSLVVGILAGVFLLSLPMGGCQLLAALKLRKGESWTFCLVTSIMSLLPLHAGWLLGIPVGIWSLSTIGQLNVRAAFYRTLYQEDDLPPVDGNLQTAKPQKPI